MTNRNFIDQMAAMLGTDADELQQQVDVFINILLDQMKAGNSITVKNFGVFDPRVKAARKMYNPTTHSFKVVPAKTTIGFKMAPQLKEAVNHPS